MKLPGKEFIKKDIVNVVSKCKRYNWYREGTFKVVSYYLYVHLMDEEDVYVHENKIKYFDFSKAIGKIHWCVKVRHTDTNNYYTYSESFLELNLQANRNKKIKELIEK